MTYQRMFATSTARSGSYLIAMMLSTNPEIMIASEPYLELFRSLRNAWIRHGASTELQALLPPKSPIQDYYFTDERIALMDTVQGGDLAIPYDMKEWDSFYSISYERVALQCAELQPFMKNLKGKTYKEIFDNGFDVIAQARKCEARKWVGIKDAWTIEYFAPLARAYPDAKFLIILRDPRAIINSIRGVVAIDPLQVVQALSYARHWRKYAAFTHKYQNDPIFKNRLHVVRHEDVVADPETQARRMCAFFEVEYDARMLDTTQYHDYSTGKTWEGNSSFEKVTQGISTHRAERWRKSLDPRIVSLVDFICGPDMKLFGYAPDSVDAQGWPLPEVINYLVDTKDEYTNWRTDLGDLQRDFGFELFRRSLLDLRQEAGLIDTAMLRRNFLFREVFETLRSRAIPS